MTRKPIESVADVIDVLGSEPGRKLDSFPEPLGRAMVEVFGEGIDLCLREPEGLSDILEDRSSPIRDDVGDHRRALPAVASIAVLDDLLPPLGLEVDVDVGRTSPLMGQEPLEWQPETDGIDPRQVDASTHR